jgi:bacillithiol biosynthesis cysteine-adding enzyme BshC
MDPHCLRHSELPGASKLFQDFLYHPERVASFYQTEEHEPYPESRRPALVAALRAQNPGNPSLDLLSVSGTKVVVTGQQVGLFSGPAYTIYKALTAVKLARRIGAVPIFWLATEDHDFPEVSQAWVFNDSHEPIVLRIESTLVPSAPAGTVPLTAPPVAELRQALKDFPYGGDVSSLVEECYREGETMGSAFRKLVERLLAPYGMLFLDPLAPEIRSLAAPLLRDAAGMADRLTADLLDRNRELEEAGYHAQVHVEQKTSLFFLLQNGRRIALRRNGTDHVARDLKLSARDLCEHAVELSPNALLRPVMQDYLMPTESYIGGPAELAYLAQSQVLYKALLGRMPQPRIRAGFTLLDPRSAKLMDRYGLRIPSFYDGEQALKEGMAGKLIPASLSAQFEHTSARIGADLDKLTAALKAFDPSLEKALGRSSSKILYQLSKIQAKTAREAIRRDSRATADASYLNGLIYPHKHLQERFYSILPFVARHGMELIGHIYDHIELDCSDHQVLPYVY